MELTIKEKFVLLAYHPSKGYNLVPTSIGYGIAGAMLMELAELKKIQIQDSRVKLQDTKKTGDILLDEFIGILAKPSRPYRVKTAITKVKNHTGKFKKPILAGLVKKRILKAEKKRFLIFRYMRYPFISYGIRKDIIEHIRRLVLRKIESDNDIPLLTGLAGACKLTRKFFHGKEERKTAKKRIKEIISESQIDSAIDETIKAVQAAVIVSVTTSGVAGS